MSLSDRHRWCVSKILEAFGPELTSEAAQAFIRQDGNIQKFNAFFKGDGPGRLFVFYQPDLGDGEVRYFMEIINLFLRISADLDWRCPWAKTIVSFGWFRWIDGS